MTTLETLATVTETLRAAGASDPGRQRDNNEDRVYLDAERGIFIVADGVGGHVAGEVAATIAISVIVDRLTRPVGSPAQRVREAIVCANSAIVKEAQASPARAGMTCVLTVAFVTEQGLTIGHVGDTRLYKLTSSTFAKLTHDHSPVGEREDAGELSEADAMRHPRRHEVFRDVGSAFHEPDDPDFIEIIETSFEGDSAILLCSDGLSDMVDSRSIERIVRRHAGDPTHVVRALLDAANDAGGNDNVTALYVERSEFAARAPATPRAHQAEGTAPVSSPLVTVQSMLRRVARSRVTWFVIGTVGGVALGLLLAVWPTLESPVASNRVRTLVVGGVAADHFDTIAAALVDAAPRDVVQIEPGDYAESVVLKDGVDLVARVPGTVALIAPSGRPDWVSLAAAGQLGNRIAGLRVVGRPDAPIAVGLRLSGHDLQVDDVSIEGRVAVGMEIVNDGAIAVRASRLSDLDGVAMRINGLARPVLRQNMFVRGSGTAPFAIEVAPEATPQLMGNLFVGYTQMMPGDAARAEQLLKGNYAIRPQEPTRNRRRTR